MISSEEKILKEKIFRVCTDDFETLAIEIFNYQYTCNKMYRKYCQALRINVDSIVTIEKIPFLPISFFKTNQVMTGDFKPEIIFESSGTSGSVKSKHFVKDISIYQTSFKKAVEILYGTIEGRCIIGLLPSYLESKNASLVYMVNELIRQSGHPASGFYLHDTKKLYATLSTNEKSAQETLLIGVTYALLDFAKRYRMNLQYTSVMETGGMKGRRKELTREEVHLTLKQQLGLPEVHAEYGMTELLSQAYSLSNGIFKCPPWMKILLRSPDDPFEIASAGSISGHAPGAVNVIDLANLNSCSFIATDDIGKLYSDESFEISGRLDNSDIRGCSLMVV